MSLLTLIACSASFTPGLVPLLPDTAALERDTGASWDTGEAPIPLSAWRVEQPADSARHWLISPEGERVFGLGVNTVMRDATCEGMAELWIRRMEPTRAALREWARLSTGEVGGEEVSSPYCFNSVGAFSERNDFDESGGDSYMIRPLGEGGAGAPYSVVLYPNPGHDSHALKDEHGEVLRSGFSGSRIGDPFNPAFLARLDEMVAEDVAPRARDPQLRFWFMGNEIGLFDRAEHENPGVRDLRLHIWSDCPEGSSVEQPRCAPHALASFLHRQYGDLDGLNAAWDSDYPGEDFTVIVEDGPRPAPYSHDCNLDCRYDLQRFVHDELLAAWVRETTTRVRGVDPNHLVASPRLALSDSGDYRFWTPASQEGSDVWADNPDVPVPTDSDRATYCPFDLLGRDGDAGFDLLAVNVYTGEERFEEPWLSAGLSELHARSGLPILVSEFGVRAKVDGWSNTGGAHAFVPALDDEEDQAQRGQRYAAQLAQLAAHPFVIGVSWHAWSDRYDPEDPDRQMNLGLMQCEDPERGLEAGQRWDPLDDYIAEANCNMEALLLELTGL